MQRLVLGADGADRDVRAVLELPGDYILRRVGADGEPGQFVLGGLWVVQDHPGVERDEVIGGGEQRVDVDFLDPRLLGHELAEADHDFFERGEVHRLAAAHAFERVIDLGALHHAAGQGGVERGQGEGLVLEHLDELAAHAEEEHRAELRVDAAAQDDLVAVGQLDHLLHGHALEVLGARLLGDRRLDVVEGVADLRLVLEVQLHAAHVGLVGDGLGVELEHDGEADFARPASTACGFGLGDLGDDGRDAVSRRAVPWIRPRSGSCGPPS